MLAIREHWNQGGWLPLFFFVNDECFDSLALEASGWLAFVLGRGWCSSKEVEGDIFMLCGR